MAVSTKAVGFAPPMDPTDLVDYYLDLRGDTPLLEPTEDVASYTLGLLPAAVAAGLEISAAAGYAPLLVDDGRTIRMYLQVAEASRESALFDGEGSSLPGILTVTTTSSPPRRRQRTFMVTVAQL